MALTKMKGCVLVARHVADRFLAQSALDVLY
jgi:hypothetical protein